MARRAVSNSIPSDIALPNNIEAERAVLGAMMKDREALIVASEMLRADSFFWEAHQKIYTALIELFSRNEEIDLFTLSETLRRLGTFDEVGGMATLTSLMGSVATTANISYHAKIVQDKVLLRQLITAAEEIKNRSVTGEDDTHLIINEAEDLIFKIAQERSRVGFARIGDLVEKVLDRIEFALDHKSTKQGVPSYYPELDTLTGGFQKSDLIILAARPSMGKTSFAMNIVQNVAEQSQIPVGIFSLEMSSEQIVERLLCSISRVDLKKVRTGYLSGEEYQSLHRNLYGKLVNLPIYVDDSPNLSMQEVRARARRLATERKDLGMIVIDYIQLMSMGGRRYESRQQEVSEISRQLKSLARDLNIPVIALSQLSRASVQRPGDSIPRLSDLRDSGAIEQDADVVMFIHREAPKKKPGMDGEDQPTERNKICKLILAKQRNGPVGEVNLYFVENYTRFEPVSPDFRSEEALSYPPDDEEIPF